MNLTTKTAQGVGWAGTSQITRLLLQLGITALLARLLTPNDFGLLAMVVVFTNLVMIFRDFGLSAALIVVVTAALFFESVEFASSKRLLMT